MDDFLPKDYEAPEPDTNYLKLKNETTTFRILGSAIVGYMYWTKDNKPIRSRTPFDGTPADIRFKDGKPERIKHFWAFLVYDYKTNKVKIMELTQSTIKDPIEALVRNTKWGKPTGYDITITRKGEGLDTEYAVIPEPHSESPITNVPVIDLNVLYEGGDPFAPAS
jgi:hypothetical protein